MVIPVADQPNRHHLGVIMARGKSSRMGLAKGLVSHPFAGIPLLLSVAELYLDCGLSCLVVTNEADADAYRELLRGLPSVALCVGGEEGDTALTLLTARAQAPAVMTHFWAHPVDLPLVGPGTLALLDEQTRLHPDRVLRPSWQGIPGHPVVLPAAILDELDEFPEFHGSPLREFLDPESGGSGQNRIPLDFPVADRGVILDIDTPDDLLGITGSTPPGGSDPGNSPEGAV